MKPDINAKDIKTTEDLKQFVASELATFDTVAVLNFQIEKLLEELEDNKRIAGWEKSVINDIHHILWASDALKDDTIKRIRSIVESEGDNA